LLALLNDNSPRFVQEQVLTTLAMVADAAEEYFSEFYASVMPVLVSVLQNATAREHRMLRSKALECAGLIALAVGKERFAPDANQFCELLVHIQNEIHDPDDPMSQYLMGTWSKVCQTLGTDFAPYLPYAMPPLLHAAGLKPDLTFIEEDDVLDRSAFDIVEVGGQEVGIRTSLLEEKCTAFENLAIYAAKLGKEFAPYLTDSFALAVPGLQFAFHEGVREAATMIIPQLLSCAMQSNTLTVQMIPSVIQPVIDAIAKESEPGQLSSLYNCFAHSLTYLGGGGVLNADLVQAFNRCAQNHITDLAERRRRRAIRVKTSNIPADEAFDLELTEESEDSALTAMANAITQLDAGSNLLPAVGHVRDLAIAWTSDDE